MNSVNQFVKLIVVFIPIVTLANGKLITLDGQCTDRSELKPDPLGDTFFLYGTYYVVEQTSMGPIDRTDIRMMLNPEGENINITEVHRSTESGECEKIFMYLEATDERGVYDVLYQDAPNSDFIKFQGYILEVQPYSEKPGASMGLGTYHFIIYLCRDLPDSKHQVEITYQSLLTELSPSLREDFAIRLAYNDLLDIDELISAIERNLDDPCNFA